MNDKFPAIEKYYLININTTSEDIHTQIKRAKSTTYIMLENRDNKVNSCTYVYIYIYI